MSTLTQLLLSSLAALLLSSTVHAEIFPSFYRLRQFGDVPLPLVEEMVPVLEEKRTPGASRCIALMNKDCFNWHHRNLKNQLYFNTMLDVLPKEKK